jgi:hypothetical protein
MKRDLKLVRLGLLIMAAILLALGIGFSTHKETNAAGSTYKILAWNDLGMHCYNRDFADLAVLPPYNNLWVQVVQAGNPPRLVTSGITVTYSYADNTYSAGKTNFWSYSKALFGVTLPPNVGLKGKGLSGKMDLSGDHFVAEGIPITEYSDSAPTVRQPYQLATVVVKNSTTGVVLATQSVVTPTSSEMRCDRCHSDTGIARPNVPTGKVETNILQLHDQEEGTSLMTSRPVLCANCHASNALGAPGKPEVPNLSKAMHNRHTEVIPDTLDGCYNCHPGPQTRCLRDVMSTKEGMTCINCHGGMAKVSTNPNPWLNEPRCDTCHDSGRFNQDKALYRFSKEHGGLYCEACHDSTHAVAPSREANDAIKFIALQGKNGPISECSVCHTVPVDINLGPHRPGTAITHVISGNAGVPGAALKYMDGTAKTALADASGNYSFRVPSNWSGRVTPVKMGVASFTPAFRTYTNVTTDETNQNYRANRLAVFMSYAAQDGFIRESTETSGVGGALNASSPVFVVGDNALNQQYRGFLSFNTFSLPDTAVILSARLKLRLQAVVGTDPSTTHGWMVFDIRKPYFGSGLALGLDDFGAAASLNSAGWLGKTPSAGVYTGILSAASYPQINVTGFTQLRLRFQLDDNNDGSADYLAFYSGEVVTAAYRPALEITYYVP